MRSTSIPVVVVMRVSWRVCAPPLGAFYWQLASFRNVLALHVTQHVTSSGSVYSLTGFDDQCGQERATVTGTATFGRDGTIAVSLTVVAPGGTPLHADARWVRRDRKGLRASRVELCARSSSELAEGRSRHPTN